MVTVEMPDIRAVLLEGIQTALLPALLATAEDVPYILKQRAVLDNEDVDGNQMPQKKPRPKKNPRNNPNAALIDTGNMLDPERWMHEQTGDLEVTVIYDPPQYFQYLAAQGRDWIRVDSINEKAREEIVSLLTDKIGGEQ